MLPMSVTSTPDAAWADKTCHQSVKSFPRFSRDTFVIGVAGGTASGKTTVCDLIIQRLHDQCCVMISQDSFYKVLGPADSELAEKGQYNFDHPDAFDHDLLLECIDTLVSGQPFDLPIYNFATHSRDEAVRRVDPADLVIIEGILVLHMTAVLERCQMKVFVDTDDDVRLARRIQRDVASRGRDITGVIQQYTQHVKPSFDEYISPSRRLADVIIPWQRGDNLVAIDLIVEHLKGQLQRHSLHDAYPNLHVVPSNFQIRGMHTVIRDETSNKNDFIFMADRLIRIVVEYGLGLLPFEERTVITPTGAKYAGTRCFRRLCGVSIIRSGESMESALRTCCKGIDIGKILVHRRPMSGNRTPSDPEAASSGSSPRAAATGGTGPQASLKKVAKAEKRTADKAPEAGIAQSTSARNVYGLEREIVYEKLPSDISERYVLLMDPILGTGRTVCRALRVLKEKGVSEDKIIYLTLIASPKGIDYICRNYPQVTLITTEIDKDIDANFRVIPGIGEFGDRYFCT